MLRLLPLSRHTQLGEAKTRLAEAEIRLQSLAEELSSVHAERGTHPPSVFTGMNSQSVLPFMADSSVTATSSEQVELLHQSMCALERDKDVLQSHLHQLVSPFHPFSKVPYPAIYLLIP